MDITSQIESVLQEFLNKYADNLTSSGCSDNLARTAQTVIEVNDSQYMVSIDFEDYFQWAENGRAPGKFPPIQKILDWVKVKQVLPRPLDNGKLPTENQLAFLIARKISREGTKGNHLYSKTLSEFDIIGKIYDIIGEGFVELASQQIHF